MANTVYASYNPQPTDNELDYSTPTNPAITDAALNLSVLQRHLPTTVSIGFLAPYAVVYTCSATTRVWEKCGIEGSLFVVKLQDTNHAVVVLNRRGLDNFILHLQSAANVDVTEEYIILLGNDADSLIKGDAVEKRVYGLWVFEEEQGSTKGVREACGKFIVECAEKTGKGHGVEVPDGPSNGYAQQLPTAGALGGLDLMALLDPSRGQDIKSMR